MADMAAIGGLVDSYVACWKKYRPQYSGIYEDNDFGCEGLQVFRNGLEIETFRHDELCRLSTLLTKSLRGQINRDHKLFWSWCSFISLQFRDVQLFQDRGWVDAFRDAVNLLLCSRKRFVAGPGYLKLQEQTLELVNWHLLEVESRKHLISGPLAFAVLEGLLRRKNGNYVTKDGTIQNAFCVVNSNGNPQQFNKGRRLSRIDDSLRLFDQVVLNDRQRPCPALSLLAGEVASLYPQAGDVYDLIDSWRNDLIHGNQYWMDRVPVILNMICLLAIDEIEPGAYDAGLAEIATTLEWRKQTEALTSHRAPWDVFPPDLGRAV